MNPQRLRTGLALALCCWALSATGCETAIEGGLTEDQANRVLVALHQKGIGASKETEGGRGEASYAVRVPQDDVARSLQVLRAEGLPHTADPGFQEVFGEGSLVPTATEERGRYAAAIAGELARSIETIDGVLDARVHVAIPDGRQVPLDDAPPSPRASVLVKHRAGAPPYDADAVRALVAGAVEGLTPDAVSVVGVPAAVRAGPEGPSLVKVGPVWVARGSATTLRLLFGAGLVVAIVLAAGLIIVVRRRRRIHRAVGPYPTGATP